MNIHVILTGGTIGSRINTEGYIANNEASTFRIIDMYQKKYNRDCSFSVSEPYNILSENINHENVLALYNEICDKSCDNFVNPLDGIIVTHGTDSLQYSSTLISYMCGHVDVPVVFVSSAYVLDDPRANGLINFDAAVNFIKCKPEGGVYVSYKNDNDDPIIHKPTRLHAPLPFTADIASIKNNWYARYMNDEILFNPDFIYDKNNVLSFSEFMHDSDAMNNSLTLVSKAPIVRIIPPYAGITYPELSSDTKAVLLETYHSGTLRADDTLKEFTKKASSLNIPVYLTGLSCEATDYETVSVYDDFEIIPLKDCSPLSQYCKLWIAASNNLDLDIVMKTSVSYDRVAGA